MYVIASQTTAEYGTPSFAAFYLWHLLTPPPPTVVVEKPLLSCGLINVNVLEVWKCESIDWAYAAGLLRLIMFSICWQFGQMVDWLFEQLKDKPWIIFLLLIAALMMLTGFRRFPFREQTSQSQYRPESKWHWTGTSVESSAWHRSTLYVH